MDRRALPQTRGSGAQGAIDLGISLPKGDGREGEQSPRSLTSFGFLYNWADNFLDHIGYFAELKRSEKSPEAAEGRIRNVKELMATLDGAATSGQAPVDCLQNFLEELMLDAEREEEEEGQDDAVTLITMHSCKGLEYPHVYIVGMEEGLLPHSRAKEEGTLDEERRLFYVALTRAMQTLTLSHCRCRKKHGTPMACHPSRLLSDLPSELVEHADNKAKEPVSIESGKKLFDVVREAVG
jgi:superfamily I DNA/RNA helicase